MGKNGCGKSSLFKAILRKLGFERSQFDKDIADFSVGQKKKVLIAASLCQPTLIFAEHDQTSREKIATKIIAM